MRLMTILFAQHKGRMARKHWYIQGKKPIIQTRCEDILNEHGITVEPIEKIVWGKPPKENFTVVGMYERSKPLDENHPDYQKTPCLIYKDNNVLVQGMDQAKVLTNTVTISSSLPDQLKELEENLALPKDLHNDFERRTKLSSLLEATQEKLPRYINPERPMFKYIREYGVREERRNTLIRLNLIDLIEQYWHVKDRFHILNTDFSLPFNAFNKYIQFELSAELSVTSAKPLPALSSPDVTKDLDLPNLYPVNCTVSITPYNFYTVRNLYPLSMNSKWPYIHTSFIKYDTENVKNIHETPVTEEQLRSRALVRGFCIAGAQARATFGSDIGELPKPVVVQVIQTNGQWFHFSVYQLNTLVLDKNSAVKNIFWDHNRIWLYESSSFLNGRPTLVGYNPEVLNKCMAFYKNDL